MKFLIDDYLLKKTEDLSFVELKHDTELNIKTYKLPSKGLDVPIITEELAYNIKTRKEDEVLTIGIITRGMIYLLGVDPVFKYRDEYIKFLYAVDPKIEEYILIESLRFLEKTQFIQGVIFLKSLISLNPYNIKALLNYSLALLEYRDKELLNKNKTYTIFTNEAKDKLEALLDIDNKQGLAYYYLGFIYKDNKEFNKAKIHWGKALKLELEEDLKEHVRGLLLQLEDMVQYEKGYEAILEGRVQEGIPLLMELEERYKTWWNLMFFIGLGYRQLNAFPEAIKYFKKVLELKSDQMDTIVELGLSYGGMGRLKEAIEYFYKAIDLGGENNEILCNLAMSYLELGNLEKSQIYVDRSLAINPNDEITIACKNKIDEVKNH